MKRTKIIPLTIKEKIYHNKQKVCYICKKEFDNNDTARNDKKTTKSKRSLSLHRKI